MQLRHDPVGGWSQLREMSGLLLKNALTKPPIYDATKMKMRLLPDASQEIKAILCQSIVDANPGVRRVSSSIIASCTVGREADGMEPLPLSEWGQNILTPFLVNCLESAITTMNNNAAANNNHMEDKVKFALLGSLQTLTKVLEDNAQKFEAGSGAAFNKIVPCLIKLLTICGEERVKVDCLKCCINMIHIIMPGSLVAQMNDFLGVLSSLATDPSGDVRKHVCRAIVTLLSTKPEYLYDHMLPVSQFMLTATSDSNEEVALEGCEFWLVFASLDETRCTPDMMDAVQSLLPQLLPVLVKSMVYSEEKRADLLEQNEMDAKQGEDRAQDVAPVFHKSKAKGGGGDDGDSDDDDDDGNYDDDREWSLRTCAAASLDSLADGFPPEETLIHLLPILQECLSHDDPWVREAGILALGAIGQGCGHQMNEHMAQLHPYLMTQVTTPDTLPQVVCISCWTLGRYSEWAVEQTASGIQPALLGRMVEAISGRILDNHRKVQIASVSSLATIVENAGELLVPFLEPLNRILVCALERHHTKSLLNTLEIFGNMAECIGPATGEGNLPCIYIPPLLAMWSAKAKVNPMDKTLLPLMESLSYITTSIGMSVQPWALELFDNAMSTINAAIMILATIEYSDEEADTIVCATDTLDGLVEGLGANFAELVMSSTQFKDHFLTVLRTLVGYDVDGVRMSAFALMGDIARQCPALLQDGMGELIHEAICCIDPVYPSVCNNAVWALGEVFLRCAGNPTPLQPFAQEVVQKLIVLITGQSYSGDDDDDEGGMAISGLVENASTTMGRLALVNPNFVAPDVPRFLNAWFDGCSKIGDQTERRDAFEGVLCTIKANPESIRSASTNIFETISGFLFALVSWHIPANNYSPSLLSGNYAFVAFPSAHADLQQKLGMFLHQLKVEVGAEQWDHAEKKLPVNVRKLLREQYHL